MSIFVKGCSGGNDVLLVCQEVYSSPSCFWVSIEFLILSIEVANYLFISTLFAADNFVRPVQLSGAPAATFLAVISSFMRCMDRLAGWYLVRKAGYAGKPWGFAQGPREANNNHIIQSGRRLASLLGCCLTHMRACRMANLPSTHTTLCALQRMLQHTRRICSPISRKNSSY